MSKPISSVLILLFIFTGISAKADLANTPSTARQIKLTYWDNSPPPQGGEPTPSESRKDRMKIKFRDRR